MRLDAESCHRAVRSRDARFDGWFYTAVTSTGIYCRPSCPAMTPRPAHLRFYPTAAGAQRAGYRACKRCRPDASPGSPEWNVRQDLVARAMRLIADGVIDAEGVSGLSRRLGYSSRQVQRQVLAEVGAGPLALARAQRAQTARTLVEGTSLSMADVAFAAGFASIRSFNDTVRAVFGVTPTQLRHRSHKAVTPVQGSAQAITLRLAHRRPIHIASLFGHLAATAVPGLERWHDGGLERTLRLPHGPGTVRLTPCDSHVEAQLRLTDIRDLTVAVNRCRRLLDLDADPQTVDEALSQDPALAPLVRATPGCRLLGAADPGELAVRVVLGQHVSTAAAARLTAVLLERTGELLPPSLRTANGPDRLFPTMQRLAELPPDDPAWPGMPVRRRHTVHALAVALAESRLDIGPAAPVEQARRDLLALPGIGDWTAEMVLLRALGTPDAFPAGDLWLRHAARAAGLPGDRRALAQHAERWRPWRSYAAQVLWASTAHPSARLPMEEQ